MTIEIETFRVRKGGCADLRAPRQWKLIGIYESPLAIVTHLAPDPAAFRLDEARESLLRWLGALDHTARENDIVRPVAACLQIEKKNPHRDVIERWESDAAWQGSEYIVYVENPDEFINGSVCSKINERLACLLFRSVGEITRRDDELSLEKTFESVLKSLQDDAPARALTEGIGELLRTLAGRAIDIEAQTRDLLDTWLKNTDQQPALRTIENTDRAEAFERRERIERLTEVSIERFRGWVKRQSANTDADLVLLTGPNGHGKSSFLEALLLSLTGHTTRSPADLLPRSSANRTAPEPGVIELKYSSAHEPTRVSIFVNQEPEGQSTEESGGTPHFLLELSRSTLWHDLYRSIKHRGASETEAHLLSVFGDRLHERFNRNVDALVAGIGQSGAELIPVRSALAYAQKQLDAEITRLRTDINHRTDPDRDKKTTDAILSSYRGFSNEYARFVELYRHFEEKSLPSAPEITGPPRDQLEQIRVFVTELEKTLGKSSKKAFNDYLDLWERSEEKQARTEQFPELDELTRERLLLEKRYPDAAVRARRFKDSDDPDNFTLDRVLAALSRNLEKWSDASRLEGLAVTREQLVRVVPSDLQRLVNATRPVSELLEATRRIQDLDREVERLQPMLRVTERLRKVRSLQDPNRPLLAFWPLLDSRIEFENRRDVSDLERRVRAAQVAIDAIAKVDEKLNPLGLDENLRKDFEILLNDVMSRIQLTAGLLPPRIGKDGNTCMADDRTIDDLSTGQKTQLAVALSVGINLALSQRLGAWVLVMDDVSAAYDVSNIAREALLWRSVAYGHLARATTDGAGKGAAGVDRQRRQLFLSSHNEDTTRKLIDLLRPPEGATMKVIRLWGWKPEEGPEIKVTDVRSAAPSNGITRGRLFSALERGRS